MASSSKFMKLHPNVLLEWVYDSENLKSENYQILTDLVTEKRGFMSQEGYNKLENSVFVIDPVVRKYAKVDTGKYNYLKVETYSSSFVQYDKLRLHLPETYSFADNGYVGLYVRVYTYDYYNEKVVDFSSIIYDDTEVGADIKLELNDSFLYDEQSWGKYFSYDIPSIDTISKQRSSSATSNTPTPNSINLNLTQSNGISQSSPIFIEFSFIVSRQEILGNTYYHMSDIFTKSIDKVPEYLDLAANITKATDGDYFEIYGTYGGDNESMDEFVDELNAKGRKVRLEFDVSLYEENILMNTQTYIVEDNFTQKLWYRPVLSFTNTTASIDVTMKVIDLVDDSQIDRLASISLTKDIFKYGKILTRINLENAWKPKIYNLKGNASMVDASLGADINVGDINLTKVNYPVISDRLGLLVSTSPSPTTKYKPMGLAEIIINPFGNTVKFEIAKLDQSGNAVPYDLAEIMENSKLTLSFKSDEEYLEKEVWQETDDNDYDNGVVVYRIEQSDLPTLKAIGEENKRFYLTLKSEKTGIRSMFYSGTWVNFADVTFIDNDGVGGDNGGFDFGDFSDLGLTPDELQALLDSAGSGSGGVGANLNGNPNSNAIVFLDADADIGVFDDYLSDLKVQIYLRKPGGNSDCLTYLYFLLNVSPAVLEDIKIQDGVADVSVIPFCVGANIGAGGAEGQGGSGTNLDRLRDRVTDFNCATAERTRQQNDRNLRI